MFEDGGLRKIYGSKWDEVTEEWKRLHMSSFVICTPHQILYHSGDQIKNNDMGEYVARIGNRGDGVQGFGG
jgi:hypothetical protein